MLIQCTKKLLNELGIKEQAEPANVKKELIFSWHANLLTINRRKAVVFVNDKNRYVIVLYGLLARDLERLDELFISAIRETFKEDCIKDEIVEEYIYSSEDTVFTKTRDKKSIARMNYACEMVQHFGRMLRHDCINQCDLNIELNKHLVGNGDKDYYYPNEEMYKDIENFGQAPIFRCKAVEMKVTLELENQEVWRKLVVPLNITFSKFHEILQVVFSWKDYHMYEFYIYDDNKPVLNIVSDEELSESLFEDVKRRFAWEVKLWEYITHDNYSIKYIYDFGDYWEHYIEIDRIIKDYSKNHPICFDWKGKSPPEDVGGKVGYEEFLNIISSDFSESEDYHDYQETVKWAENKGYFNKFHLEIVNERLKQL